MRIGKEEIKSRQNKLLIWIASLGEKKYRDEYSSFCADGYKLFEEAAKSHAVITHVLISASKKEQYMPSVMELLCGEEYAETQVLTVSDDCFDKLTREKSPQGVVTVLKYLDKTENIIKIYKVTDFVGEHEKALILSSLRDPSNLGAVLRSACAFGTETILLSQDCADIYNPKTVRAAMGALFRVRCLICEDLAASVRQLREKGRRVFAAELTERAVPLDRAGLARDDIVVIGNEGHGIAPQVSAACNGSVYLPISSRTESLNAAVAASIFLWEQRS